MALLRSLLPRKALTTLQGGTDYLSYLENNILSYCVVTRQSGVSSSMLHLALEVGERIWYYAYFGSLKGARGLGKSYGYQALRVTTHILLDGDGFIPWGKSLKLPQSL